MSAPRVAVIGGGVAGLTAACRLQALGVQTVVLEAQDQVGGVVRSERRDGWIIDTGPCMAAEPHADVRALLNAAGADAWGVRAGPDGPTRFIVYHGAPVPVPRSTAELTASPLLSIGGRLRLLKERFIPTERVAEETADHFARRRYGDEMADRLFDPRVISTCGGDPREILARYAFPSEIGHEQRGASGLQGSMRERMQARRHGKAATGSWSCANGMQQLPEQLAASLADVRHGVRVTAVRPASAGFEVAWQGRAAPCDGVIFATPAAALGTISVDLPEAHRLSEVATMPHASIAAVSLGFHRRQVTHPLDGSRLLVPSVEQRPILSMVFPSSVFDGRTPPGHVLITVFIGGARGARVTAMTPDELVGIASDEVRQLLGVDGDPVMQSVAVWPDALPQAVAGHSRRLAAADAVEAMTPAVAFAGAWRDGLSVSEVMLGGTRAAERLASRRGWLEHALWH